MTTAKSAIEESIGHNKIVTIDHDRAVLDELKSLADDWVEAYGATECWGRNDEGDEWRVHVTDASADRICDNGECRHRATVDAEICGMTAGRVCWCCAHELPMDDGECATAHANKEG